MRTRLVTLVLVRPDGEPIGRLPPFEIEVPWWPEAWPLVDAARERHGIGVAILRLLSSPPTPHGGAVTYAAELDGEPPRDLALTPPTPADLATLADHPLRQSWARPGGPAAHVAWAASALSGQGRTVTAPPRQVRTWNLSTLWQLPTDRGDTWLKVVPPFFGHEGAVIEALGRALGSDAPVPPLLAHDGPRMLVEGIPGDDLYDAPIERRLAMVDLLVDLQASTIPRVDDLLAIGAPDLRAANLAAAIEDVVARAGAGLDADDRHALRVFVAGLPDRLDAIAGSGLPDVLVHGDFHPGNLRGTATDLTILDWGDSHLGHPLLDEPAMLATADERDHGRLRRHWHAAWRRHVPEADPARASQLLAPMATARLAVIYQGFLDRIEPTERPYHAADPAHALRRTADLLRAEPDERGPS